MEEIADVEVLLMQLKSEQMFNCHYEVEEIKKYKINRLASILNGEL